MLADKALVDAYREGSDFMLAALRREREGYRQQRHPEDILWNPRTNRTTWAGEGCYQLSTAHIRLTAIQEREEQAEALRVNRDPCPRCGVRYDLHGKSCKQGR